MIQRVFLLLMIAGTAAAQPRPFSHKLHLRLKLPCVACHATVTTSTKASDNNLPPEKFCLACHDHATIKQPAVTGVSKFNHQLHIRMGNVAPLIAAAIDKKTYLSPPGDIRRHLDTKNACEACHRGMEESEAVSKENFPRMADCLVCHNKIDLPFSCEQCHDDVAALRPASHSTNFIDLHSSGKANLDKPSCTVCHGRNFRCMGCH